MSAYEFRVVIAAGVNANLSVSPAVFCCMFLFNTNLHTVMLLIRLKYPLDGFTKKIKTKISLFLFHMANCHPPLPLFLWVNFSVFMKSMLSYEKIDPSEAAWFY